MKDEEKSNYEIKVNGIQIKVSEDKLVASDILKLAAENKAIGTEPENYVLESDNPPKTFKNDEWVNLMKYKEFTAEMSAPTPVAFQAFCT